jgi:hypothetical protein
MATFAPPDSLRQSASLPTSENLTKKGGPSVNHPKKKEKVENVVEKSAAFSLNQ